MRHLDALKPKRHVAIPNIEPSNCILTGPTGQHAHHPREYYRPPPGFEKVLLLA